MIRAKWTCCEALLAVIPTHVKPQALGVMVRAGLSLLWRPAAKSLPDPLGHFLRLSCFPPSRQHSIDLKQNPEQRADWEVQVKILGK